MSAKSRQRAQRAAPSAPQQHHSPGPSARARPRTVASAPTHNAARNGGEAATQAPASRSTLTAGLRSRLNAGPTRRRSPYARQRSRVRLKLLAIGGAAIIALAVVFALSHSGAGGSSAGSGAAGQYAYAVGDPGPGAVAPEIQLPSTVGGTFDLAALRGKTVLFYFQEGLTCQPCWDQLKDIDSHLSEFRALGIDEVVSVTTDQVGALRQKVADEGIISPVLSDPTLRVSTAYSANQYGMMGTSRDGHSFVVVGPDGRIRWRADYGGPPNYTMYVPVPNLIADLRRGLDAGSAGGSAGQ